MAHKPGHTETASNNPSAAAKNAKGDDVKKNSASASIRFNNQMYLLDWMSEQLPGSLERKFVVDDVTDAGTEFTNSVTDGFTGFYNFLMDLSPSEYAQLIPQIRLFLVWESGDKIELPLVSTTNIADSLNTTKNSYYSGKAAGLKGFDMTIDGSTNPVTGRIYNITMDLVFDSINTFLGLIPGSKRLTYADVFRALGSSSSGNNFYLRLAIQYSTANDDLKKKYALEQDTQSFIANLKFKKSELNIDENLKTNVKVHFWAHEEALIANSELFNFLVLDLDDAEAAKEAKVGTSGKDLLKAKKQYEEALKKAKQNTKVLTHGEINKVFQSTLKKYKTREAEAGLFPEGEIYIDPRHREVMADLVIADAKKTIFDNNIKPGSVVTSEQFEQFYKAAAEHDDLGDDLEEAFIDMYKQQQKLKKEKKKLDKELSKAKETYEGLKARALETLAAERGGQIGEILAKMLWNKEQDLWTSLKIDSEMLGQYIDSVRLGISKDFFKQQKITPTKSRKMTQKKRDSLVRLASAQRANKTRHLKLQRDHVDRIKGKLGKLEAELKEAQKYAAITEYTTDYNLINKANEAGVQAGYIGDFGAGYGEAKFTDAWKAKAEALKQEVKKLNETLKEEKAKESQVSKEIVGLDKTQLEKNTMNFKTIEYVLLGDLVGTVLKHIKNTEPGMTNMAVLKTVFLLGDVTLENLVSSESQTFNLYDIPIDKVTLQKMFSDRLQGQSKNTFTLKELISEVVDIVRLAQQRKHLLLGRTNSKNNFSTQFYTYPIVKSGGKWTIQRKPKQMSSSGVAFFARDDFRQDLAELGGSPASNRGKHIPHFYIGGYATGAQKKIKITELDDEAIKKAVFERNQGAIKGGTSHGNIPVFFTVDITLVGTPYFQLASYFYLESPTLNTDLVHGWFHLDGYYQIYQLSHSYKAGGHFTTTITGKLQCSKQQISPKKPGKKIPAKEAAKYIKLNETATAKVA